MLLRLQLSHPIDQVQQVVSTADLLSAQAQVRQVFVHEKIRDYIVRLVQATRNHPDLALGASPRGSLGVLRSAQAMAAANGLSFVLPDHVKAVLLPALAHRIILTPEARFTGRLPEMVLHQIVSVVEPPVGEAYASYGR
jgi:MoxR-like ATPase